MAKNTKQENKKVEQTKVTKEPYIPVTERWWGKLLIWLLIIGTLAFIFITAVYYLGIHLTWWK